MIQWEGEEMEGEWAGRKGREGDIRSGSLRWSRPCRRGGCAVGLGERSYLSFWGIELDGKIDLRWPLTSKRSGFSLRWQVRERASFQKLIRLTSGNVLGCI